MADVKWIKLATNIFDNRKIKQIERMPEGDALIVIWLKLLVLAGNVNDSGAVYFTRDIPYTDQLLATEFGRPLNIIQLALETFRRFGMIDIVEDVIHISNWEKYQNVDRMAEIREYNRLAQQRSRERKRLESPPVNDRSMTGQRRHETDIDIDIEKEKDTSYLKEDEEDEYIITSRRAAIENAWKDEFGHKATPAIVKRLLKVLERNAIDDATLKDCITRTARREANDPANYLETLIMEEAERDRKRAAATP